MASVRFAAPPLTPALRRAFLDPQRHAPVLAYLMTPVALGADVLAAWRVAADMGWVGEFFISSGLLSRWQVWLALGVAMHVAAHNLNRAGKKSAVS